MAKKTYPIILVQEDNGVFVDIPDFEISTQGDDLAHAMEMARDAIGLMGIDMEDDGVALPEATAMADVKKESDGDIITLVDVDFGEYRRKNDLRTVKKNCTIPSWLNFEAEKAGVNFSAILQAALKRELKLTDR